jgi:hypothetical protein
LRCTDGGALQYAGKLAEGSSITPMKIRQLSDSSIVVAGHFSDSLRFAARTLYSYGNNDIFAVSVDTIGTIFWQQQAGSVGFDKLYDIIDHPSAAVLLTGLSKYSDVFSLSLSYRGEPQWIITTEGSTEQYPCALTHDKAGNVYIAGLFHDTLRLNQSMLQATKGVEEVFFAKLYHCENRRLVFRNDTVFSEGTALTIELEGIYEAYDWVQGASVAPTYTVTCAQVYQVRVTDSLQCVYRDSITVRQIPTKLDKIQIRAQVDRILPAENYDQAIIRRKNDMGIFI